MPFYQCQKCKEVWQYPIGKCPDCFSGLERLKSKKVKVIGCSRVNTPTILHPKTPYFALVLEDEMGNRWVHKSEREYKIGDEFSPKANQDKNAVAIWRIKYDVLETIEKVIALVGGINVSKDTNILILPTLVIPKHPHLAENTSPEFLEAVLKYLIKKGGEPTKIKVAGQSFDEFPVEASIQKSQLLRICKENKITLLDLAKQDFAKTQTQDFSFKVSQQALDNDLIINLPILKLDAQLRIKGAAHNTLKLLKKESYLSSQHLYRFQDLVKKISGVSPKFLNLAEADSIQKQTRQTVLLGLVLASFNSLNLDRVFAEIVMQEDLPKYLKDIKIENIPITGRSIKEVAYKVS